MQTISFDDYSQDIPEAIFPDEAIAKPIIKAAITTLVPFTTQQPSKPSVTPQSFTLKIARAISGATEIRLLAEQDGNGGVHFVVAKSTIAPYTVTREVLVKRGKNKTPLNKKQATEEFDRLVTVAYPPEKLRNEKLVAIHLNLL